LLALLSVSALWYPFSATNNPETNAAAKKKEKDCEEEGKPWPLCQCLIRNLQARYWKGTGWLTYTGFGKKIGKGPVPRYPKGGGSLAGILAKVTFRQHKCCKGYEGWANSGTQISGVTVDISCDVEHGHRQRVAASFSARIGALRPTGTAGNAL